MRSVGIDRSHAIVGYELKQTQLRREVMREIGMIVHVIAPDIRETSGRKSHAVEPILIEAVARRLQRQMVDARLRELGKQPMQCDCIGRRMIELDTSCRRYQTNRAEAGGVAALTLP